MDNCIFCKIIKGDLPSEKIYEDETHIAILDLFPVTKGHALLIPKMHHINIFDSDDDSSQGIYNKLKKIAKAIQKAANCGGINIVQNNEACAGQVVFHSHIHIIPRYEGDSIIVSVSGKKQATAEELRNMGKSIVDNMKIPSQSDH